MGIIELFFVIGLVLAATPTPPGEPYYWMTSYPASTHEQRAECMKIAEKASDESWKAWKDGSASVQWMGNAWEVCMDAK